MYGKCRELGGTEGARTCAGASGGEERKEKGAEGVVLVVLVNENWGFRGREEKGERMVERKGKSVQHG